MTSQPEKQTIANTYWSISQEVNAIKSDYEIWSVNKI